MADRGLIRQPVVVATLSLAAALLLTGSRSGNPPVELVPGSSYELELEKGQSRLFAAHAMAGSLFHLVADQNGADLAIEVEANGRTLPTIDLFFGAMIREHLYFTAAEDTALSIRIRSLDGRGKSQVRLKSSGPPGAKERALAREFETFWYSSEQGHEARCPTLRRLAAESADPWMRVVAAGTAAILEPNPSLVLRDLELASSWVSELDEPAFLAQLGIHRARALVLLDQMTPALASYRQAHEAALAAGDQVAAAIIELDLGNLAWSDNNSEGMIRHYTAARRYFAAASNQRSVIDQEINLARSLMRRGSSPEPLARLLRLLAAHDAALRPAGGPEEGPDQRRSDLLLEIGWWLHLEGRSTEGRPLLEKAVELDPKPIGSLQRLSTVELTIGDFAAARATLQRALANDLTRSERAGIESSLCRAELLWGNLGPARSRCERVLVLLKETGREGMLPGVHLALARVERQEKRLEAAEHHARLAAEGIEDQRRHAGDLQEMMEFRAVRGQAPELLVELRLALHAQRPGAGWDSKALEAAESTRALLLRDLLSGDRKSFARTADSGNREEQLRRILEFRTRGLVASLLHQGVMPERDVAALEAPLRELEDLRGADSAVTETGSRGAAFDLGELARELGPGVLLLVFHLGQESTDQAFGWALTGRSLQSRPLGSAAVIRRLAAGLHGQMAGTDPRSGSIFQRWSARLAEELYSPFAAEIAAARQVVVVAPAELQYLPFAALPFPAGSGRPLLADRALTALPSAAILPVLRRRAAARRPSSRLLAIVDDPVYDDDPRLPAAVRRPGPFLPLPDTAIEGRLLLELAGEGGATRITGFAAARDQLLGEALTDHQILHFATHARTGSAPRGLVLSRFDPDGRPVADVFGFRELASLSLDADLVVTSACSSALGELVPGEGLLGLSHGFLSAGVPRLLLTLWPVRGEPSRRLVAGFYRRLLAGMAPAEALRQTQWELYERGHEVREWAAFELYGDWRPLPDFPRAPRNKKR